LWRQAQRVTDLVHHRVSQRVEREPLRLGTVGLDVATGFEEVERKARLLRSVVGGLAQILCVLRDAAHCDRIGNLLDTLEAAVAQQYGVDADVGVEDLARARIGLRRTDAAERRPCGGHPADRRVPRVECLPVSVVGLNLRSIASL
jgi:hypothetical protein